MSALQLVIDVVSCSCGYEGLGRLRLMEAPRLWMQASENPNRSRAWFGGREGKSCTIRPSVALPSKL